jgi:DNA helicase-2/ATP-dependent DNA helicase PcrA
MKNKLIVAAAGSGKTTHLVKEALKIKDRNVLISTFTEVNGEEIKKKFYKLNGCIPSNITVQTWFSFLLEHGVRPFQGGLIDKKVNGILLVNQASGLRYITKNGIPIYFSEKDFKKYYFTEDYRVYTDKLAKLVIRCNQNSNNAVIERISDIFPYIFIDEIQDLAGYDLEILKYLLLSKSTILLVGDPRQVTYHTHNEKKYSKYKDGNIIGFIEQECKEIECEIDIKTLNTTHRNNSMICEFADKLYPNFPGCYSSQKEITLHDGVYIVKKAEVDNYLDRYKPMQLRDSRKTAVNENYDVINIGNSKGLTFDRVLIYPTKPMLNWIKNHDSELKAESRAKLYVALTRAKYSAAIVMDYTKKTEIEGVYKFDISIPSLARQGN